MPSADITLVIPWWPTWPFSTTSETTLQSRSTQHQPTPQPRSPAAKPSPGGLSLGKSKDSKPHPQSLDEGSPSSVLPKHCGGVELKTTTVGIDQIQKSQKH